MSTHAGAAAVPSSKLRMSSQPSQLAGRISVPIAGAHSCSHVPSNGNTYSPTNNINKLQVVSSVYLSKPDQLWQVSHGHPVVSQVREGHAGTLHQCPHSIIDDVGPASSDVVGHVGVDEYHVSWKGVVVMMQVSWANAGRWRGPGKRW